MSRLMTLGAGGPIGFSNSKSLSCNSSFLSISAANFGSFTRTKFAISLWWKPDPSQLGTNGGLICQGNPFATQESFFIITTFAAGADKLAITTSNDGADTINSRLVTTASYSSSIWRHFLYVYDSAQATATNRQLLYVNGVQVSSFVSRTDPTQNTAIFTSTDNFEIGDANGHTSYIGLLDEIAFFDNVVPDVTTLITGTPGRPKDLTGLSGLKSWVRVDNGILKDQVLSASWTNNSAATVSSDAP